MTRLARIMEAQLEKQLSKHGVTRLMWCVLRGVGLEQVTTPSALADYICIARPAVSRLLKAMETKGLVVRKAIGNDARFTEVCLTPLGEEKLKLCHVQAKELNTHFMNKLDTASYEALMQIIDLMTEGEDVTLTRL